MAHGHHDTGLSWEWDSVLLLSNPCPLASSSLEADGSNSSGLPEPLISAPVSSSDHLDRQYDSLLSNDRSADHIHTDSRSSETQDKDRSRDKRRDPRLECPNFLAGKVPCACTDNDDDDNGVSRKRSRPVPRCQVAACGAELTDLKGYHQRHRVCLRCAHATRVTLRQRPHRYCQQCGKFHPICDFDEGKRSCRRKLEKHNNRRRRKAGEDSLPALDYGDADTQNESSPGDVTRSDELIEGELKDVSGEKPSFDSGEARQTAGPLSNEKLSVVIKVSETSDVPDNVCADSPLHALESSAPTGVKENLQTPSPAVNCTEVPQHLELELGQEQPCSLTEQIRFSVELRQESIHTISPDDFSLHSSPHPEAGGAQMRRGNDEESLLALLMEENGETDNCRFQENAGEHLNSNPMHLWETSTSPRRPSKEVAYISSLPTGRISFKLYDWNPGDFPRDLRQQVMEWLSNMPVDLEGYIRSGCTILTIFIAMPQSGWDGLNADWTGAVLRLVNAEQSFCRFWSSGYLIACMGDHVVHINDGQLARPLPDKICKPPILDRVRPLCLEAGCDEEVVIVGRNFQQVHSRLLVSFDGKYVVNDEYQSHMQGAEGAVTRVHNAENGDNAMLFATIPALLSGISGTAYIEVEHLSGTSNYIPLLVAEKKIVDEIRSLEKEMDKPTSCCNPNIDGRLGFPQISQRRTHSLLLDLGWVLKNTTAAFFESEFQIEILELHLERLRRLLFFGVKRNWCNVVERVLQLANRAGLLEKIGVLNNGLTALQVAVLHHRVVMVEHLISCAESMCASSSRCQFWWNLGFPGPKGLTTLHFVALQPGLRGLFDRLMKREGAMRLWSLFQDNHGSTPLDYSPLSYRSEISDLSFHNEGTTKGKGFSGISDELPEVQWEGILSSSFKGKARISLSGLQNQGACWKASPRTLVGVIHRRLPIPFGDFGYTGSSICVGRGRKKNYQFLRTVTIVLVCAGLCVMQRPNQVILLSMSLRRCLWGLENGSQ